MSQLIDLALKIANELYGPKEAQAIQLMLEYNPEPEFKNAGSPLTGDREVVQNVKNKLESLIAERRKAVLETKQFLKVTKE